MSKIRRIRLLREYLLLLQLNSQKYELGNKTNQSRENIRWKVINYLEVLLDHQWWHQNMCHFSNQICLYTAKEKIVSRFTHFTQITNKFAHLSYGFDGTLRCCEYSSNYGETFTIAVTSRFHFAKYFSNRLLFSFGSYRNIWIHAWCK